MYNSFVSQDADQRWSSLHCNARRIIAGPLNIVRADPTSHSEAHSLRPASIKFALSDARNMENEHFRNTETFYHYRLLVYFIKLNTVFNYTNQRRPVRALCDA